MGLERPTPLSLGFEPFGQIGDSELLQHVQSFLCRVFAALPVPNATKSQAVRGRRGPETTLTLTRRLDAWGGLHAVLLPPRVILPSLSWTVLSHQNKIK